LTVTAYKTLMFTIANLWNQPRCPSTDEQIKKMWFIYTIEYYSVIRKMNQAPVAHAYSPVLKGGIRKSNGG
jgi:hypothetical protein